jgi:hypothetical protein
MQDMPFKVWAMATLYRYDTVVLDEIHLLPMHHAANFLKFSMFTGHEMHSFCEISKSSHALHPLQYFSHVDFAYEAEIRSQSTFVRNLSLLLMASVASKSAVSSLTRSRLYLGSKSF